MTKYEDTEPDTHFQYETRTENYSDYETATEKNYEHNKNLTVSDLSGYVFSLVPISYDACI